MIKFMLQDRHDQTFCNIFVFVFNFSLKFILIISFTLHALWLVCVAVYDVWLCLCSYAGSVATTMTGGGQGMDYLDQLDDCNIDLNGLVNLSELMQGYKP